MIEVGSGNCNSRSRFGWPAAIAKGTSEPLAACFFPSKATDSSQGSAQRLVSTFLNAVAGRGSEPDRQAKYRTVCRRIQGKFSVALTVLVFFIDGAVTQQPVCIIVSEQPEAVTGN